jgi:undecaprenyl-diphosphatase
MDRWLVLHAQSLRGTPLDEVFTTASNLWVMRGLAVVLLAWVVARGRDWTPVAIGIAAVAATSLATTAIKALVDRTRPPFAVPGLHALGQVPGDASFPSGHASTAFAAAIVLGASLPRLRPALLGLAALVAVSRVWLGVHYPSDVLAGAALGAGIGLGAISLTARVRETRDTAA